MRVTGGPPSGTFAQLLATDAWAPNTAYLTAQEVTYQGNVYQAISGFTSGSSFNPANWNLMGPLNALPTWIDYAGTPTTGQSSLANLIGNHTAGYLIHFTTGASMAAGAALVAFGVGDGGATAATGLLVSQKTASSGDAVSLVNQAGTTGYLLHVASQATSGTGAGVLLETNNASGVANPLLQLIANGTPGTAQKLTEWSTTAQAGRGGPGASLFTVYADTGIIDLHPVKTRVQSTLVIEQYAGNADGASANVSQITIAPAANMSIEMSQYSGSSGLYYNQRLVTNGSTGSKLQTDTGAHAIGSETWVDCLRWGASGGAAALGLYGVAPVTQQARAGQLNDNSGGASGGNTIAAVAASATDANAADLTTTKNAIATLAAKVNALELAHHNIGLTA